MGEDFEADGPWIDEVVVRRRPVKGTMSPSRKEAGWESALAHGEEGIVGQAVTRPFTEDDRHLLSDFTPDPVADANDDELFQLTENDDKVVLAVLIGLGLVVAGVALYPKIRAWNERRRARNSRPEELQPSTDVESVEVLEAEMVDDISAAEPGAEIRELGPELTGEQWMALFTEASERDALGRAHLALSAEQLRYLQSARIIDDPEVREIVQGFRALSAAEVGQRFGLVIESSPAVEPSVPEPLAIREQRDDDPPAPRTFD